MTMSPLPVAQFLFEFSSNRNDIRSMDWNNSEVFCVNF